MIKDVIVAGVRIWAIPPPWPEVGFEDMFGPKINYRYFHNQ